MQLVNHKKDKKYYNKNIYNSNHNNNNKINNNNSNKSFLIKIKEFLNKNKLRMN